MISISFTWGGSTLFCSRWQKARVILPRGITTNWSVTATRLTKINWYDLGGHVRLCTQQRHDERIAWDVFPIQSRHMGVKHDDVIKWKYFPRYWPFLVESTGHRWIPLTGQWRGALIFSLICAWTNNDEAGNLRRHGAHYDVTVTGVSNHRQLDDRWIPCAKCWNAESVSMSRCTLWHCLC